MEFSAAGASAPVAAFSGFKKHEPYAIRTHNLIPEIGHASINPMPPPPQRGARKVLSWPQRIRDMLTVLSDQFAPLRRFDEVIFDHLQLGRRQFSSKPVDQCLGLR